MKRCRSFFWAASGLIPLLLSSLAFAANQSRNLSGPEKFVRTTGATTVYSRSFTVPSYVVGPYQLHIDNGNPAGTNRVAIEDAVSSGRVILNGVEVVSPSEFSKTTATIDKTVTLTASNTLEIHLNSAPDSYITLTLSGTIPLGDLGQVRSGHTATLLANGKVLITGGSGATGILSSVELFDPATLAFSPHPNPLTTARSEHTATLLPNTESLLVAGKDPQGVSFTAELFSPSTGLFRMLSNNLKSLRSGHTATQLSDGRVLIIGGADGTQAAQGSAEAFDPRAVDLFDPKTGAFTSLAQGLNTPRIDHTATLLPDGRVLILGGSNATGTLASGELFDPVAGRSTLLANAMTIPRAGHTATLLPGGKVLIAGGKNATGLLNSVELFDPSTQTFTAQAQSLLKARFNQTATLLPNGEILIAGGDAGIGPISHTELYGPPAVDGTAPTVLSVSPGNGATKVFLNTIVSLRFSEPVKVTTLTASSLALTAPGGVAVAGTVSPSESGLLAFIVPNAKLTAGTTYTVALNGITDIAGNPLPPFSSSFTTYPAPKITGFSPTQGGPGTVVTVSGENFDVDTVSNNKVTFFNGIEAGISSVTATTLTVTVPAGAVNGPIMVTTPGGIATSAQSFIVQLLPVISSFSPTSGPIGRSVTIIGKNFDPSASNNLLSFNGKAAIITSATTTQITTTVPQDATSGAISITTSHGTATSAEKFAVTPAFDFSLSLLPATLSLLQGGSTTALVALSSTGPQPLTALAALSVSALPPGVTATFDPPQLTLGGRSFLRIAVGATAPTGSTLLTMTGSALIDGKNVTRSASITLTILAGGRTAVAGQFLTIDGAPLPGVKVGIGTVQGQSDAAGNFLLLDVPSGTQPLMIDANAARAGFPMYAIDVALTAGVTNLLPPFRLTPPPPPERFTPINNAAATQVITDPRFPGVEITLPAGVTITGWDGAVKTKIAVERLSPDRLPVPPPPGPTRSLYQIYFGTPMGGMPSAPLPVAVPNDLDLEPGESAELWYFDASPLGGPAGWRRAGLGTVSADGSRVVSNPGVGIQRFCGVCGVFCFVRNQGGQPNNPPGGPGGGDPVDLAIGQMTVEKSDLTLPGRLPVTVARTYNPLDPFGKIAGFELGLGPGWALSVDIALLEVTSGLRRLILPGNTRIDFTQRPDGSYINAAYPEMAGAVLTAEPGGRHLLRFKDGATWRFASGFVPRVRPIPIAGLGLLVEQGDRSGNRLLIERDTFGMILRLTESAGRQIAFTQNGTGRYTGVTDPLNRTVQYAYTAEGHLATVTDPAGGVTRYAYHGSGGIETITDARGIAFLQNFYGGSGRVLRQLQADGGEWRFTYQVNSPASSTGPNCAPLPQPVLFASGSSTAAPAAIAATQPPCPTTESWELFQQGYQLVGGSVLSTTMTDPRGQTTTYQFNNIGYPTQMTDPLGQVTQFERAPNNQPLATTDPLGRKSATSYDAAGNATSITDADGNITRYEYEPQFNHVTKITDPLGRITQFAYDLAGNLTSTTDPLGKITTLTYNPFGQPLTITDPLGNTTQFEYDPTGNLIATIDPLGNRTVRAYDDLSRLNAITDPLGRSSFYVYDLLNRVTKIVDPAGGETRFTYDPNGNLLSVADAKGQKTSYNYDVMDRLESRVDPLLRTERYLHDPNGNLTRFTDRKGQITTFTYDPLNRRREAAFADGSRSAFSYDAVGRLFRVNDTASGAIDLAYDNLNRLIQEITSQGMVAYGYDPLGRRASMTVNGQTPVGYQYDANSRLTQVSQGTQTVGLGYDAVGRRTTLSYPNGTNTLYNYDVASRITNILHQSGAITIENLTYSYDAAGNRTGLTRANAPATVLPAPVQAAYDAANQQIQFNSSTPNLTYDANGNLISQTDTDGTTTYSWDARNRLIGISGPGVSASFVYDVLGRRVSKTINGMRTDYQYDGQDIVAEIGGGAIGANYLRSLNIDEPFVRQSNTSEYYHADALGSTLRLTDAAGATTALYTYEAFGKTTVTGTSTNPFQYTGRENDGTGLYYYRARYYSPELARFFNEDPLYSPIYNALKCRGNFAPDVSQLIEIDRNLAPLMRFGFYDGITAYGSNPQHLQMYVYTSNNPINNVDSTGLRASPQSPGCDIYGNVPGFPQSSCAKKCCNDHDDCYTNANSWCDATTWIDPTASFRRPDCLRCNRTVVECLARNRPTDGRKPCK